MLKVYLTLVSILPSFLQKPLRMICGAKFGRGSKIRAFSFVLTRHLTMEEGSSIGPLVAIRAETVHLGRFAKIRPISIFKVRTLEVGAFSTFYPMVLINCAYGPRSSLKVGKLSCIHSFSVIEPGEGITIGDRVVIGGECAIFCHSSGANYLKGASQTKGPVRIDDDSWIAWRVMLVANTHVQERCVVGSHSLVHGVLKSNFLYLGVPAKPVLDQQWRELSLDEKRNRFNEIRESFRKDTSLPSSVDFDAKEWNGTDFLDPKAETLFYSFSPISAPRAVKNSVVLDLERQCAFGSSKNVDEFLSHMETFGVRIERFPKEGA